MIHARHVRNRSLSGLASTVGLSLGTVVCAVLVSLLPSGRSVGAVIEFQNTPVGFSQNQDRVIVELDAGRPLTEIQNALAEQGFSTWQAIPQAPARYCYRYVVVDPADTGAKARLLQVPGVKSVRPSYRWIAGKLDMVSTGELVVKFKPATTQDMVAQLAAQYGLTVVTPLGGLRQTYLMRPADGTDGDDFAAAAALGHDSRVAYAHPDLFMADMLKFSQTAPIEDALFDFQWHLRNRGQLAGATPGADVKAVEAWQYTLGENAIVGINDTAVQWRHEDLFDNFIAGYDYVDQDNDPSPEFDGTIEAHGTSVAGLIAGRANSVGVRGVAPMARFTAVRFSDFFVTSSDIASSFLFHEASGAHVINNSWGLGGVFLPTIPTASLYLPDVISEAITQVATEGRGGRGVLVTYSAGNESMLIAYGNVYASLPGAMAIGATLPNDLLTCYSNFGPEQSVVAPGGGVSPPRSQGGGFPATDACFEANMVTTDIDDADPELPASLMDQSSIWGYNPPTRLIWYDFFEYIEVPDPEIEDFPQLGYTRHFNGTSAACPVASGVAALVFSVSDTFTAEQVRNIMEHTADKIQSPHELFDPVTGHNDRYGHGRLNASRAVQAAQLGELWPSPVTDLETISTSNQGTLMWTNPVNDVFSVLVARGSTGALTWTPIDGVEYTVGQQVAPNVVIVANSLIERLDQDLAGLPAGNYQYALFVRNSSSYYSWGRRASFSSTGSETAPKASISTSVATGKAPLTVQFFGGAVSDLDPSSLTYLWQFGDGGAAAEEVTQHTFNNAGNYDVRLMVTNTLGETGMAMTRVVVRPEANAAPTVQVSATPTSGTAPLAVVFRALGADSDGTVERYDWTFDDGSRGAFGATVEHVYIHAGVYQAKVTATDDRGATAINGVTIVVNAPTATAAETDPPNALNGSALCGSGAVGGLVAAFSGLMLMLVRSRRR